MWGAAVGDGFADACWGGDGAGPAEDVFETGAEGVGGIGIEEGAVQVFADDVDITTGGADEGRDAAGEGLDEGDGAGFVGGGEDEPVGAGLDTFDLSGRTGEPDLVLEAVTEDFGAEFLGVLA